MDTSSDYNGLNINIGQDREYVGTIENVDFNCDGLQTVEVCGHYFEQISGREVTCVRCGETKHIPDILKQSTGFVQTVWKLYLLGELKNENDCKLGDGLFEQANE